MPEVIRPSIEPDAPRRALVPRVYDRAKLPDPRDLKKAIRSGDPAEMRRVGRQFTREQRLEILAEMEQEQATEIRKSGSAMPADERRAVPAGPTKVNWASAFRLPRWGGRPAQPAQQAPAPAPAPIYTLGSGKVRKTYRPQRGGIVHFTTGDGMLLHGKLIDWGTGGAIVAAPEGEYTVDWTELHEGVAPAQQDEHREWLAKSESYDRDRKFRDTVHMLTLSPEDRAAWWARRHDDL